MGLTNFDNKFRSVKITHDTMHRVDFSYLAEFFRFMGVFVCEEILMDFSYRTEAEMLTKYDASIYVGVRAIEQREADKLLMSIEEYSDLLKRLPEKTVFLEDIEPQSEHTGLHKYDKETQRELLFRFMDCVLRNVFSSSDLDSVHAEQLRSLSDIYVDQELWLHSMNLQYYSNRPSAVVADAKEAFLESYKRVKEALQNREGDPAQYIYEYAMLWCEVKINTTCDYNREISYFPTKMLVGQCKELCERYPRFSNAKILLGLSYESSNNSANEALWAFHDALQDIESECFASPVYYWMGKRYESYHTHQETAEEYFKLANQRKNKFRNYFKLAVIERNKENFARAIELFEVIPQKLSRKMWMMFADPLELEYLFKVYTQECYIYHKTKNYVKAIEVGEKAVAIRVNGGAIDQNLYFGVFYGEDRAENYRDLLRSRLDLSMVYWLLVECYTLTFDMDKAEEYRKRAISIKK